MTLTCDLLNLKPEAASLSQNATILKVWSNAFQDIVLTTTSRTHKQTHEQSEHKMSSAARYYVGRVITSTKGTIGSGRRPLAYLLYCVITVSPQMFISTLHRVSCCSSPLQGRLCYTHCSDSALVKVQCLKSIT